LENYENCSPKEQNGHLIFIFMIKKLVSDTEAALNFIQDTI